MKYGELLMQLEGMLQWEHECRNRLESEGAKNTSAYDHLTVVIESLKQVIAHIKANRL